MSVVEMSDKEMIDKVADRLRFLLLQEELYKCIEKITHILE